MRSLLLFSVLAIINIPVYSQEFQEISCGAGYTLQSFINLETGVQTQSNNEAWDIAFSDAGQDAGIFINESSGTVMGIPVPSILLYNALTDDFSEIPDTQVFLNYPLFNTEASWSAGAFNEVADPEDPFDFGWGSYNPATHQITGSRVFVITLRDSIYRKIQVQSLAAGVYSFRIANLDGTEERISTVAKSIASGNVLAYYSFATDSLVDIEPSGGFDLLYGRYYTVLDAGDSTTLEYAVTGILSGPDIEVAQANGIDPEEVSIETYLDSFQTRTDIIGHDWKEFNLNTFQWSLSTDRVYFVRSSSGNIWKLNFIDFEGSSTGNAVFEKTDLGIISPVLDIKSPFSSFDIYPNPTISEINLVLSTRENQRLKSDLLISDITGKIFLRKPVDISPGLNSFNINAIQLLSGTYQVSIRTGNQIISKSIFIAN